MSKTTSRCSASPEVIIKPTTTKKQEERQSSPASQVKRIKSENEVLKNDDEQPEPVQLQNRFNKSNPDDMKRLRLLKDKIRRCELQLAKHQSKLETLNTELNALNSQTTAND